jgi:hypothetical protein
MHSADIYLASAVTLLFIVGGALLVRSLRESKRAHKKGGWRS